MSIVEKAADRLRQSERERATRAQPSAGASRPAPAPANATPIPSSRQNELGESPVVSTGAEQIRLDVANMRRSGLLAPKSMADQMAREYQRIKRPLLASLGGDHSTPAFANANRLLIASAKSGEGKTFTAFNLALSLAKERDHSVLLVDGDVIKPSISRAMGVADRPGLMDLLSEEDLSPVDVILESDVPGLSVLPAGQRCQEMAELLSSRRMRWLTEEVSSDPTRIVVFDSPPLLATPESQALALNIGQVVMVVRAGSTERRAVEAALSLIEAPNRPISLILNQTRKAHGDAYAGYYGMYYGDNDEAG